MSSSTEETKYFFELTPEKILAAVERQGVRCTGRVLQLNSMENRVYEVKIDERDDLPPRAPERYRIVKFYRPGRWSREQILEEHSFLNELRAEAIRAVAPLPFPSGETVEEVEEIGIYFSVFPKQGGRSPDELLGNDLERMGALLARVHFVGRQADAPHRLRITPQVFGRHNLEVLISGNHLPEELEAHYSDVVLELCDLSDELFDGLEVQRLHGDCHLGNVIFSDEPYLVDFDDMVVGPPVQDLWLLAGAKDQGYNARLERILKGYESLSRFDDYSLEVIEPLRALRYIHFSAWIAKRWHDPIFPKTFPEFGTDRYWAEQINDLTMQLEIIRDL